MSPFLQMENNGQQVLNLYYGKRNLAATHNKNFT